MLSRARIREVGLGTFFSGSRDRCGAPFLLFPFKLKDIHALKEACALDDSVGFQSLLVWALGWSGGFGGCSCPLSTEASELRGKFYMV